MNEIINALPHDFVLKGKNYKYIIKKWLGQGTFGITYLAEIIPQDGKIINGLSLTVAIKEFFMKTVNGRENGNVTIGNKSVLFIEYKEKFLREANNLAKMSHKNIVNVLEAFEQNNTVYYSMEYIEGDNLDEYISRKGCLTENEAVYVTKEIGCAISYMHSLQMLHLDVKPLNIMRKKDGSLKLIDFGLSKQYDESGDPESSTSVGGGTPGYAPIEQANYKNGHGFPITMDVYALGATLYKMLVGKRPPLASDILNDGFPINNLAKYSISAQTKEAIQSAMYPLKKNRPQSIDDFLDMLPMVDNQKLWDTKEVKKEIDTDELTEIVDVNAINIKKRPLCITNNTTSVCFIYTNTKPNKCDITSYKVEISKNRVKASYIKGNKKEVRRSYFMNPTYYTNLIKEIDSLQINVINNNHSAEPPDIYVELVIKENDNTSRYYSNSGKGTLLLDGDIEGLCKIMEHLIHINKLIIHDDSPVINKVMYWLFKNKFY